jgi:polyhydroxybutyrate depolymerase
MYPLVVMLHGDGGDGKNIRTRFALEEEAKNDAIFVYPNGDNHTWRQAVEPHANDDLLLFDVIVAKTIDTYRVDSKRVFVTGFSSGAYMTNQLACWRGDAIRAIAPMSGGGPYDTTGKMYDAEGHLVCKGKAPAVMIVHGDADNVVPFNEAQKSLTHWSFASHCGPLAKTNEACAHADCGDAVTFCKIAGAGHQVWKEAPARVWQFFSAFH